MSLWFDFRYAFRVFRKTPSVTAILVLTLALAIGANTAIYSVVDATLLRPLPYPAADRLVTVVVHGRARSAEWIQTNVTGKIWEVVRDHANLLDASVFSEGASGVNFAASGNVQFVKQQRVGAGFFRVLGVAPMVGREFTRAEDRPGGPALAILSYHLWKRIFQADPSIVGRTVMLRGEPYTVIGIMPAEFTSSADADLWTPLRPTINGEGGGANYHVLGRLKPGATRAQAAAQVESLGSGLLREMVETESSARLDLVSLQQGLTEDIRRPVVILWAAVGLVLLIGCANIASLLLARAATRTREIATRMAIGGGRVVIVRQLLMESVALALVGGTGGVLAGYAGIQGLKTLALERFPAVASVRLDARVLAVSALLAFAVSLAAGLFPAFETSTVDIRTALSEAGGRGVAGSRKRWSRKLLVSGEIALAMLLLIGAGLLVRTLSTLYSLRPGFDPENVISASFSLQDARYATSQSVNRLLDSGLARIREIPGVESAAAGLTLPYDRNLNDGFRHLDGPQVGDKYVITDLCYVTPGYFETLRFPLLAGRTFRETDGPKSAGVVIVNDAFARKYLAKQTPVGSHIEIESGAAEVVGVVGDVQQQPGWGDYGPLGAVPIAYIPVSQTSDGFLKLVHTWFPPQWVVRSNGPSQTVMRGIQDTVAKLDPMLPIAAFRTMKAARAQSVAWQRFLAVMLGALSGLALVLALVGIYGLMSQSVTERRRELGIRMALGSTRAEAIRKAASPGLVLAVAGIAGGCVLAALSANVLRHVIWGISATDPATYVVVAAGLLLVAAAATFVPARRIAQLNPADTLREE